MSAWFLDASVLLAAEDAGDEHHRDARRLLGGNAALTTLDLALYEATNVAVRVWQDPRAARRVAAQLAAVTSAGELVRVDAALLTGAAEIAGEHAISVYDAAYVAAARATDRTLVSCDVSDLVSRGLALLPHDAVTQGPER